MKKKNFKGMNYDNFDRFLINFMGVNNSLPTAGDESLSHMEVLYKCYHKILECMKAVDCLNKSFQLLKDFVIEKLKAMEERLQEIEQRQDDLELLVNSFETRISALENFVENILTNEDLFNAISNWLTNNSDFIENLVNNNEFINSLVENLIANENFSTELFENLDFTTNLNDFIANYLTDNPVSGGDTVVSGKYIDVDENSEGEKVLNSTGQAEFLTKALFSYRAECVRDVENEVERFRYGTHNDFRTIFEIIEPYTGVNGVSRMVSDILGVRVGRQNEIPKKANGFDILFQNAYLFGMGNKIKSKVNPSSDSVTDLILIGAFNELTNGMSGYPLNRNSIIGYANVFTNITSEVFVYGRGNKTKEGYENERLSQIQIIGANNEIGKTQGGYSSIFGSKNNFNSLSDSHVIGHSNSCDREQELSQSFIGGCYNKITDNANYSTVFGYDLEVKNYGESASGRFNISKPDQLYSYGIGDWNERKNLFDGIGDGNTNFYTTCNFTEGLQINGVDISPSETDIAKQFRTMYSTGTENSISDVSYRKVLEKTIPKSDIAEGFYHNFYTSVRINRINSSTHDGSTFGDDYGFCDLTLVTNLPSSSSTTPSFYGQIILENKKGDTSEYNLADNLKLVITEIDNVYKVTLYIKGYKNHLGIITNDELYRTPTGNEPIHWNNFTEQVLAEQPTTLPTGLAVKETDLT